MRDYESKKMDINLYFVLENRCSEDGFCWLIILSTYSIYLEIYNLPELQQLIAPYFDDVVKEHYYSLLNNSNNKPLEYLKKELEKSGITEVDQS